MTERGILRGKGRERRRDEETEGKRSAVDKRGERRGESEGSDGRKWQRNLAGAEQGACIENQIH